MAKTAKATSKAECIRRARELRQILADLIDDLEQSGQPGLAVQPRASFAFEKARSLEREVMALVSKGKG